MIHSFVLTNAHYSNWNNDIGQFYPGSTTTHLSLGKINIGIRGGAEIDVQNAIAKKDNLSLILSGKVTNLEFIKKMLLVLDSNVVNYTMTELVLTLYRLLGKKGVQFLEGSFSIVVILSNEILEFYTDKFNAVPIYFCISKDNYFWVTNEVKTLLKIDSIDFTLNAIEKYRFDPKNANHCSLFSHIEKMPPAHQLTLYVKKTNYIFESRSYYNVLEERNEMILSKEVALPLIDALLEEAISEGVQAGPLAIPLSGGLDSSLISAMVKRKVNSLQTFAIGTEQANEFYFAKKVSDFIGSQHHEILMSGEDLLNAIRNTVFYNEVVNSLCVEIQAPFYLLYEKIKSYASTVLTGYGADAIFGGHMPLYMNMSNINFSAVNNTLRTNLARSIWRGEYATFVASKMGVFVQHPFCSSALVSLALRLDPKLKLSGTHVKYILRELACEREYLPEMIAYSEKVAIEVASSINQILSQYLGLGTASSYQQKDRFIYAIFKDMFENKIPPDQIDIGAYRTMIEPAQVV